MRKSIAIVLAISASFLTAFGPAQCAQSGPGPEKKISAGKPQPAGPVRVALLAQNELLLRPQANTDTIREPSDLLNLVPGLRELNKLIPRQFSLADHQVRLISDRVIIEHELMDDKTRAAVKNSVISFTYTGAWGSAMGAHVDVPLFYASRPGFSRERWVRYPMGNYTMTINRSALFGDERFYIRALTRF